MPGDCTVTDAPLGNPVTERVTLPVLPVRVSVAVMLELARDGRTRVKRWRERPRGFRLGCRYHLRLSLHNLTESRYIRTTVESRQSSMS